MISQQFQTILSLNKPIHSRRIKVATDCKTHPLQSTKDLSNKHFLKCHLPESIVAIDDQLFRYSLRSPVGAH